MILRRQHRYPRILAPLIGALLLVLGPSTSGAATSTTWTGAADNSWTAAGNWTNGTPSSNTYDVVVPPAINAPAITTSVTIGALEIQLGAVLHINDANGALIIDDAGGLSGDLNNAGTLNLASTSSPGNPPATGRALTVDGRLLNTGTLHVGNGGLDTTMTLGSLNNVGLAPVTETGSLLFYGTGTHTITVSGDWLSAGTFMPTPSTDVSLSGTGQLSHTSIDALIDLDITGGTRTLASDLVVLGTLNLAGGAQLSVQDSSIQVDGAAAIAGGMTATGGTQMYGSGLTLDGTYDNGTNDVTVLVAGTLTNNGTATMGSGLVAADVFNNSNTGAFMSTSGEFRVMGNFSTDGSFTHNDGTVAWTDSGTITTDGNVFFNVTKRGLGTTALLNDALTLLGVLTVDSGVLGTGGNNVTVGGNVTVSGILDIDPGTLVLKPTAGTTQILIPGPHGSSHQHIIKQDSGSTQLATRSLVTTGDFSIDEGTFAMADQALDIGGALAVDTTATLTDTTGTLNVAGATTVDGTVRTSGPAAHTFGGVLALNAGGQYDNGTNNVTVTVEGDVSNAGTVVLGAGEVNFIGGANALSNTNIFTSTSGDLNIIGDMSNTGTYNHSDGTINFGGTHGFATGGATTDYHNICKMGAGTTTTLLGDLNASLLCVDSGTLDLDTHSAGVTHVNIGVSGALAGSTGMLTVSGDLINGGSYAHQGRLVLSGTGILTPGLSFYQGNLETSGSTTLTASSTFHFAGESWTNTGTFTAETDSTVKFSRSGDQLVTTGNGITFYSVETDNNDTVTFASNVTINSKFSIAGGSTVRDVTPGSVYNFASGSEVNVSGAWEVVGSAADAIKLWGPMTDANSDGIADDVPSDRWTLIVNTSGRVSLDYVHLRSSELISHGGSINGKNVAHEVESNGNLSPSWGPFDPVPIPVDGYPIQPVDPGNDGGEPQPIAGDANGDGLVNLADFSILAATFGTSDERADFDGDGQVSLADFSILAANFGAGNGAGTTAPPRSSFAASGIDWEIPHPPDHDGRFRLVIRSTNPDFTAYTFEVAYDSDTLILEETSPGNMIDSTFFFTHGQRVYAMHKSSPRPTVGPIASFQFRDTSHGTVEGIAGLRGIQAVDGAGHLELIGPPHASLTIRPSATRLLSNYPNPFNPETWIPFELAEQTAVTITIHDLSGRLIRSLQQGRLPAGRYTDRSSAAHWDGRNDSGERVASGVYLYSLRIGKTTTTRKMLIAK